MPNDEKMDLQEWIKIVDINIDDISLRIDELEKKISIAEAFELSKRVKLLEARDKVVINNEIFDIKKRIEKLEKWDQNHLDFEHSAIADQLSELKASSARQTEIRKKFGEDGLKIDEVITDILGHTPKLKDGDSEALKEIKKLAKEESEFYNKHGYFSFWSDKLKAQRIKEQNDGEKSVASVSNIEERNEGVTSAQTDSRPSKCEFYDTKTDICNNEMWDFSDEPGSCVLWGQRGCSKFEPKEPPEAKGTHITTCPKCGMRVEIDCHWYNEDIPVEKADLEWLITTLGNYLHRKNIKPTIEDQQKRLKLLEKYLKGEDKE